MPSSHAGPWKQLRTLQNLHNLSMRTQRAQAPARLHNRNTNGGAQVPQHPTFSSLLSLLPQCTPGKPCSTQVLQESPSAAACHSSA